MFSNQFLASYHFFSAAVAAYRTCPEEIVRSPDSKAVADAFKKATLGMSGIDQIVLKTFILRLYELPEKYERDKDEISCVAAQLDTDAVMALREDDRGGDTLGRTEFMARASVSQDVLAEKVRQHRIFSFPYWYCPMPDPCEELYPAFFADPTYELSSLESVSMALRASPAERKYRFFVTPNALLDNRTPLQALAAGELERVIEAARAFRRNPASKGRLTT